MPAWLDKPLTTLAFCWRLQRRDGVTLGFTSHDRDLTIAGLRYRAAPGLRLSSIEFRDGLESDSVDISGALTDQLLTAADLEQGRWDGAALRLFAVDWSDPDGPALFLTRGTLGQVEAGGAGFEAGVRAITALLDRPIAEETSPECRATLGDARCRVDLAPRTAIATVQSAAGSIVTMAGIGAGQALYAQGRLRWLDGGNAGTTAIILASEGPMLTLAGVPPVAVVPGDRAIVTEGCDRRLESCAGRFANAVNFRGEPHLPGADLLTRYA